MLGFGLLLYATLHALMSSYVEWTVITIVGFPLTIGSFLIFLGTR